MPTYPVPARFVAGYRLLAELDEASFEGLASALESAPPRFDPHSMYGDVAERSGLEHTAVESILDGLISPSILIWRDGVAPITAAHGLRIEELEDQRAV